MLNYNPLLMRLIYGLCATIQMVFSLNIMTVSQKNLSQIFYFNDDWTSAEGGFFDFLTSSAPRKTIFSGLPDAIYSYMVKCTPNAWHEVKPVTG